MSKSKIEPSQDVAGMIAQLQADTTNVVIKLGHQAWLLREAGRIADVSEDKLLDKIKELTEQTASRKEVIHLKSLLCTAEKNARWAEEEQNRMRREMENQEKNQQSREFLIKQLETYIDGMESLKDTKGIDLLGNFLYTKYLSRRDQEPRRQKVFELVQEYGVRLDTSLDEAKDILKGLKELKKILRPIPSQQAPTPRDFGEGSSRNPAATVSLPPEVARVVSALASEVPPIVPLAPGIPQPTPLASRTPEQAAQINTSSSDQPLSTEKASQDASPE